MKHLVPLTLLFTIVSFVGCTQEQPIETVDNDTASTTVAASNAHCPIMGGEVTDDGGRFDWNDKTIGFCCPGCIEKFEALSDEEKAAALAKADAEHKGHDQGAHDHGNHDEADSKAS